MPRVQDIQYQYQYERDEDQEMANFTYAELDNRCRFDVRMLCLDFRVSRSFYLMAIGLGSAPRDESLWDESL